MPGAKRPCPFCGETEGIYSYYRDGGSTLNHPSCKVDPLGTWPNPDFNPPWLKRFEHDT